MRHHRLSYLFLATALHALPGTAQPPLQVKYQLFPMITGNTGYGMTSSEGKVLTDKYIISADREEGKKELAVSFFRYDRETGAHLGTSVRTVVSPESDFPRFERLLKVGERIYLIYTTRTKEALYTIHAVPYDAEAGHTGPEVLTLGELQFDKKKLEVLISELKTAVRFVVSDDQRHVLMYHDEMKAPDKDGPRVVSIRVFDDNLAPVWKTVMPTPGKYNVDYFSDLVLSNAGDVYALNSTSYAKGATYAPELDGNYMIYRWSGGELSKERIVLPDPWHSIMARMTMAGGKLRVGGYYVDKNTPDERGTAGAFEMSFDPDLKLVAEARTYPLPQPCEGPMYNMAYLARRDGGCYLVNREHRINAFGLVTETRLFIHSIGPDREQEWYSEIPRAQETRVTYSGLSSAQYGYTATLHANDLVLFFYDTEANLERYQHRETPDMTKDPDRVAIVTCFDDLGTPSFQRLMPKESTFDLEPFEHPVSGNIILSYGTTKKEGDKWAIGGHTLLWFEP